MFHEAGEPSGRSASDLVDRRFCAGRTVALSVHEWIMGGVAATICTSFFGHLKYRTYLKTVRELADRHGIPAMGAFLAAEKRDAFPEALRVVGVPPGDGASAGSADVHPD
jgi:hypothetical protein